ncbi:MFS transporter [Microbacterium sp. Leaf288]|uniref:MFS transporter n=1 Tax=Microbacterium sp. Leaf288 TaxID=1736323 RepID=UPI0006F3F2FD|nr:MFS transporter [Microbacterium sp. Leaf288]KQP67980.1 MFS transporter [Microbacterium sp. Leaf288]
MTSDAPPTSAAAIVRRVGGGFITLYVLAYMGVWLALLAPVLVTLPLKINSPVGPEAAPAALGLVTGVGALLALVGNPFFGRLSDRTTARLGMRRPWMIVGLIGATAGLVIVAMAPTVWVVVVGWSITQLAFNALLAAVVAIMADQIPEKQRGAVSGVLGICAPIALVVGAYVVQLVAPLGQLAMFMFPMAITSMFVIVFMLVLKDRRLSGDDKPVWSFREFVSTFYTSPRKAPDFAWAWISRFLFVMGQSFLLTYQAFYLLNKIGISETELPDSIFIATLVSSVCWVLFSLVGGKLSDMSGRRKIFVLASALVYGIGLFVVAISTEMTGFLIAMAITGAGIGIYFAVDLALVTDVLPDRDNAAKDLGVFNIASALPQSIAPAIAPAILAVGGGDYSVLFFVAGACTIIGALAVLKVKGVR